MHLKRGSLCLYPKRGCSCSWTTVRHACRGRGDRVSITCADHLFLFGIIFFSEEVLSAEFKDIEGLGIAAFVLGVVGLPAGLVLILYEYFEHKMNQVIPTHYMNVEPPGTDKKKFVFHYPIKIIAISALCYFILAFCFAAGGTDATTLYLAEEEETIIIILQQLIFFILGSLIVVVLQRNSITRSAYHSSFHTLTNLEMGMPYQICGVAMENDS